MLHACGGEAHAGLYRGAGENEGCSTLAVERLTLSSTEKRERTKDAPRLRWRGSRWALPRSRRERRMLHACGGEAHAELYREARENQGCSTLAVERLTLGSTEEPERTKDAPRLRWRGSR